MTGGHAITTETVDLRILAGGGMTGVWAELKPGFEQASGHRLDIFFGTTPNLINEAISGRPFDAGIVPADVMQDPAARARFASGPTIEIARAGIGVAVRNGASKPDIETPEAFKAALLDAASIATVPESATGYSIARVFERLGITDQMKAKTKAQPRSRAGRGGRRLGRGRVGALPRQCAYDTRPRRRRALSAGAAGACRFHGRAFRRHEEGQRSPGVARLPQEPHSRCNHQVERNDPGIAAQKSPLLRMALTSGIRPQQTQLARLN